MNRFVKRNTVREIEIAGYVYNVDFGKDETPFIFQEVAEKSQKITGKDHEEVLKAQKEIFKTAINNIIGNQDAAKQIFEHDNSAVLHADVYSFLYEQYMEVMTDESPYSPKRIK